MPIKWDANADAKLFACVLKVFDIKTSGAKLEEVAALMGDDCTPRALTHRLSKIRAAAASSTNSPSTPRHRAPTTIVTPRTKSSVGSVGKHSSAAKTKRPMAASNDAEAMGTYNDEDDEEPPFVFSGKRLFKSEDEEVGVGKRIKKEEVDGGFEDVEVVEVVNG